MAWSGGVFTRTNGTYSGASVWASDQSASISIVPSRHDTHDLDLATGINQCVNKDGSNATGIITSTWLHADAATRHTMLAEFDECNASGTQTEIDFRKRVNNYTLGSYSFYDVDKAIMPYAGKITALTVLLGDTVSAGSLTVKLYKNGSYTSSSVTINTGATNYATFSAVSFSAGDNLSLKYDTSGFSETGSEKAVIGQIWGHFTA